MSFTEIYRQFLTDIQSTSWVEYVAVFAGIASVWFSRIENIWVYPTGLINTIFYVYISIAGHLYGEASVNFYYTVMSVYGWYLWLKKDNTDHYAVVINFSNKKEWLQEVSFFAVCYMVIFLVLTYMKKQLGFAEGAIPWADAFASATAYTGMWLMARKKVESWYWWIATNITSIPLYFVKHYVFTSVYYLVLLILAFWGLSEWKKRAILRPSSTVPSRG